MPAGDYGSNWLCDGRSFLEEKTFCDQTKIPMNKQITGLSTEALLTQLEFEELSKSEGANAIAKRVLRALAITPATAIFAKIGLEAIDIASSTNSTGATLILSAVLLDLKRHEKRIDECNVKINRFFEWLKTDIGGDLFRQAIGVADRTADPAKVSRVGRLLLNGSASSGSSNDDQILLQRASEFLRIAEILIDANVFVLRAIYAQQKALVGKYRELTEARDNSNERQLQDEWSQAVFTAWKETRFTGFDGPIRFIDVLSALQRLEAQGLIGPTTTQFVSADIASTPYGLLDLGALFVEQTLAYDGQVDNQVTDM